MNKFKKLSLIIILLIILIFFNISKLFEDIYDDILFNLNPKIEINEELSIIVNMKNLTTNKHILFYEVMKKLNSTRNYYFIKTIGKTLNENLTKIVENSTVKIVQSNFPDSIFLPLVVSLYGTTNPEYALFIEGDELKENCGNELLKWIIKAYKKFEKDNLGYCISLKKYSI